MLEFRLPDVGEGLEEAELVEWLVVEGEAVARDQPLAEILTDKAQVQLPAPAAGTITRLAASAGDMIRVGGLLVVIDDGVEANRAASGGPIPDAPPRPAPSSPGPPAARRSTARASGARPKAAPTVRKLAVERGVDLTVVTGSGPGGRILASDVEGLAARGVDPASAPTEPAAGPAVPGWLGQADAGESPLRGIRRVTAESMGRSWSQIPHIWGMDEIDATNLVEGRAWLKASGRRVTPLAFFVLAAARALRRFPLVNASVDPEAGTKTVHDGVHVGIAVATEAGLVVPVVRDADHGDLFALATEITRLSEAARAKLLTPADLTGGTFTISNYGTLGGRFATPLIRPPEVAILGFGAIRPRPLVVDGQVVARPTLPIAMGADHRLIDGDLSEAFKAHVAADLSDPRARLLDG